jgi:4-amino-4-deoxy-L-arabinose transferase-like glycosyltransferase
MLQSGDWVVPRINGRAYIAKPPGVYWQNALIYAVLGVSEVTARLGSALAALALAAGTGLIARRLTGDPRVGLLAALIMAVNPFVLHWGRKAQIDVPLTLWMLGMYWCLAEGLIRAGANERRGMWGWMLAAGGFLALANLYKGPVPLLFMVCAMIPGMWALPRDRRPWLVWLPFLMIGLGPFMVWSFLLSARLGAEATTAKLAQELELRVKPTEIQQEPIYFYLVSAVGGLLPWSLLVLAWSRDRLRALVGAMPIPALAVLAGAGLGGLLVLSLVPAKEGHYMLPTVPALAILLAVTGVRLLDEPLTLTPWLGRRTLGLVLTVAPALVIATAFSLVTAYKDRQTTQRRSERAFAEIMNAAAHHRPVVGYRHVRRYFYFYSDRIVPFFGDLEELTAFMAAHPDALVYTQTRYYPEVAERSLNHRQALHSPEVAGGGVVLIGNLDGLPEELKGRFRVIRPEEVQKDGSVRSAEREDK